LVSILIPFKNTAHFLPECLDSILQQSYSDWEIVAIDDHSTDASNKLLHSYAGRDPRIKVFKNDGTGIIPALQKAYALSKGEFITRMDSDDIMKPIPSPCWMLHRSDFETCDAFRPNRYPEDYDLTFRFYEKRIKVIPCNQVLHLWRDYDTRTSRTHEHYAQNYFLDIKLHYFLKLDYKALRPLVIWGQSMHHFETLKSLQQPQSIITVANETAQAEIRTYLDALHQKSMTDYFFFC